MTIRIEEDIHVSQLVNNAYHSFYFDDMCGTEIYVAEVSYVKACAKAKKEYSRIKNTNYGVLHLTRISLVDKDIVLKG